MSTVLYRNAIMLVNGTELTGALHELSVDYTAELLDETAFGDDTRIMKGGLLKGQISGKGFFDPAVGIEAILFPSTGVDDVIFTVFPDGITEGSQVLGVGYAMKSSPSEFNIGAAVGQLLDITFSAASRGIAAPGVVSTP